MIFRIFLFPFSVLYGIVTWFRNQLYDLGYKPSASFDLPLICIGNLSVGGTGKTPMVEYLIRLFSESRKVATLSRGYKRNTKGFRIATSADDAHSIGDEPIQFFRKFEGKVMVAVGEDRAFAIPEILQTSEVDLILLDDAFQHRRVNPSFSILLSDYNKPFYSDLLLPAGRLRESRAGAARASVVVVTKCPASISAEQMLDMEKSIREYAACPVFFSSIEYGAPVPFRNVGQPMCEQVVLVTGIANASPLFDFVKSNYKVLEHLEFSDHHEYTLSDVRQIVSKAQTGDISIITTEKDMVKLSAPEFAQAWKGISTFYLPISVRFIKNGRDFDEMLLSHVREYEDKNFEQ